MLTALGMESVLRPYSDCTTYRERAKAPGRHGLLTNPHDDMSRMASNPAKQLVAADVFTAGVRARGPLKRNPQLTAVPLQVGAISATFGRNMRVAPGQLIVIGMSIDHVQRGSYRKLEGLAPRCCLSGTVRIGKDGFVRCIRRQIPGAGDLLWRTGRHQTPVYFGYPVRA